MSELSPKAEARDMELAHTNGGVGLGMALGTKYHYPGAAVRLCFPAGAGGDPT